MSILRRTLRMRYAVSVTMLAAINLAGISAHAQAVTLVPNATRYAGIGAGSSGYNGDFGAAGTTSLNQPSAVAFDGFGNLLIADRANNCVRREDNTQLHFVTTIAGLQSGGLGDTCNRALNTSPSPTQGLLGPAGVAADSVGNVYISDTGHNCVRLLPSGATGTAALQTIAGTCGATTLNSTTPTPTGLAVDESGNLYITIRDTSDAIYQVLRHAKNTPAGSLCRVAGNASSQGVAQCADITGTVALVAPGAVALDGANDLYIADSGNNCVRKLRGGTFSVALGTCGSNASVIPGPTGLAFSLAGNLFVSLASSNRIFRYNQDTGLLTLVAGNANGLPGGYSASQDGAAASALPLNAPSGLVEDGSNNLYVADTGNSIVRQLTFGNIFPRTATGQSSAQQLLTFQINAASNLTVTAGTDYTIASGVNTCAGPQSPAAAGAPPNFCSVGVIFTPSLPGTRNSAITVTDSVGGGTVAAGLQGAGIGAQGLLFQPRINTFASGLTSTRGVASDSAGNVYVLASTNDVDARLLRYPPGGGAPTVVIASGAGLRHPVAVARDAAGNWFIADTMGSSTGGPTIQRYGADGSVNVDFQRNIQAPSALFVDGFGNLIIAEQGTANDILKIFAGGERRILIGGGTQAPSEGSVATAVKLLSPSGVVISPNGTLYASDAGTHRVYSVDAGGLLHFVAGTGDATNADGTNALGQNLLAPGDLAVDPAGDLFIVDSGANKVYVVFSSASSSANLARLAGRPQGNAGFSGDGGTAGNASLRDPQGVTVTSGGEVYIADNGNGRVRLVTFDQAVSGFGQRAVNSYQTNLVPFWNTGNNNLLTPTAPVISNAAFTNEPSATSCGSVVIPGLLCNFAFTFHPTALQSYSGTATISDNAPSSPQTVTLNGQGVTPAITTFVAQPDPEVTQYGGPYVGTVFVDDNGGDIPTGTFTFTIDGTVTCTRVMPGIGNVSCTLPDGGGLSVGQHAVTITFTNGNYPNQSTSTTLTVTPRALTELVNSKTKAYLQPVPALDGAPNGFIPGVNGDGFNVTYNTSVTTATPPGTYVGVINATVTPAAGTVASNYIVTVVKGDFTVTQSALPGFGAGPETQLYGGGYTGTASYTASGVAPTGTVTFRSGNVTLCTTAISANVVCNAPSTGFNVGSYPITVSFSGDATYLPVTASTTLTVTPAPLRVVVDNQSKTFGSPVPPLTGSVNGLVANDTLGNAITVSYSTTVDASTQVGTYPNSITATVAGPGAGNYTATVQAGSFTVTSAASTSTLLTATPSTTAGAPVTFNVRITSSTGAIPTGAVTFTADGALLGTSTLDVTGNTSFTTSVLASGSRTIIATYAGNANFGPSSASITQVVTVPAGSLTITATPDAQFIRGPGDMQFSVSVTSKNGYVGSVALTCSGLPADAKCVFKNATLTVAANTTVSTTFTTTTTNADATVAGLVLPGDGLFASTITAAATLPMNLGGLGLFAAGLRRRRTMPARRWLMLVAVSVAALCLAGCGCPDTAFHTYPITVVATPTNGGPAPASVTVYLAVGRTAYP